MDSGNKLLDRVKHAYDPFAILPHALYLLFFSQIQAKTHTKIDNPINYGAIKSSQHFVSILKWHSDDDFKRY